MSFAGADKTLRVSGTPLESGKKLAWGGGCSPDSACGGDGEHRDLVVPARRGPKKREFTKTQEALIRLIAGETALRGCALCTKRELAERLGRNVKTIDRCVADLRRRGVIDVEPRFDERGGQLASAYRVRSLPASR